MRETTANVAEDSRGQREMNGRTHTYQNVLQVSKPYKPRAQEQLEDYSTPP